MRDLRQAFEAVFGDAESIIAEATAEAQEMMNSSRRTLKPACRQAGFAAKTRFIPSPPPCEPTPLRLD